MNYNKIYEVRNCILYNYCRVGGKYIYRDNQDENKIVVTYELQDYPDR